MKVTKLVQAEIVLVIITIIWGSTFTIVKKALLQELGVPSVIIDAWISALDSTLVGGRLCSRVRMCQAGSKRLSGGSSRSRSMLAA